MEQLAGGLGRSALLPRLLQGALELPPRSLDRASRLAGRGPAHSSKAAPTPQHGRGPRGHQGHGQRRGVEEAGLTEREAAELLLSRLEQARQRQ